MGAVKGPTPGAGPALFARGGGVSPLLALAALLLSLLGALDLAATAMAVGAFQAWPGRLAGSLTVAVDGRGVDGADAAAELLATTPGLAGVRVLDPAPGDALAGRLLGLAGPPRLVTARFAVGPHPDAGAVRDVLGRAGFEAAVDDHGPWTGPLERAALLAAAAAGGVAVVGLAARAWVAGRIAARRLRRQERRARLLVQLGATEATLSRPVGGGATVAALLWASLGAAAVAGAGAVLIWTPSVSPAANAWLASRGLPTPDALALAAALIWPAAVAPLAAWASGAAARAALRKLS